jgi:hypothetical protein
MRLNPETAASGHATELGIRRKPQPQAALLLHKAPQQQHK